MVLKAMRPSSRTSPCFVDVAHTAGTQAADDLEAAEKQGSFGKNILFRRADASEVDQWRIERVCALIICRQQRLKFHSQLLVISAGFGDELRALLSWNVEGGVVEGLEALVEFGGHGCFGEFSFQPGSGHAPVALDGAFGDAEDLGDFFKVEAAEEMVFDDAGLAGVELGEVFEGLVQDEDVDGAVLRLKDSFA